MLKEARTIYSSIAKLSLILLIFGIWSCRKVVSYPPEPEIKFVDGQFFLGKDDLGNDILFYNAKIYFSDGDGNIGWGPSEENPGLERPCDTINTHDLYVDMYEMINGVFVKRAFNTDYECNNGSLVNFGENSLDANIPFMLGRGQENILLGDIEYSIELPPLISDTIRFEFVLSDRENNLSNRVESPEHIIIRPK